MKSEQYVVKFKIKGRERTQLWEPHSPLGLGSPIRWVLERNENGVFIRDLTGKPGEVIKDNVVSISRDAIENGKAVDVPGARGPGAAQLRIHRLRPIPPAFAAHDTEAAPKTGLSQLFAFAGVLRTVVGAQAMHSAYVAYAKGRPTFTVYRNSEGYKVKPLLNGVHLKFKGEEPTTRPVGEAWQLGEDELLNATVTRGRYWWRFNLVSVPARVKADHVVPGLDEKRFKTALRSMGALLLLLLLLTWIIPLDKKPAEELEPVKPVVKFRASAPKQRNDFAALQKVSKPRPPTPAVVAEKPSAVQAAAPLPKPMPAPKVADANVGQQKAAPSPKEGSKARPVAPGNKKAITPTVKVPTTPTIPPEVLREKQAAQAAAVKAKALREALGGSAMALASKNVQNADNMSAAIPDQKGGSQDAAFAPTEVQAGNVNTAVRVGTIGGKNGGREGGVGYAVGEHAKLKGQGGSFVAMQTNDSVVDEGLTKEEVGAVIHAHMGEVRYCHEASMLANPKIEGKLMLQFGINPQGIVSTVSVQSTTLPERKLTDCVMTRLKTWRFPRPKGGIHVTVSYPFLFKTLGKD
jgi:outer membrane biosynthesis protein TonB